MTLPVQLLDDRDFQQLVDEAKRLIPTYCPEWTNHNLSDPGVALIELFAWMTEMALYRLNQVPDRFYTHMLNLMGLEQFPAAAARAAVTFWVTPGQTEAVTIPAGWELTTRPDVDDGGTRIFTTVESRSQVHPVITAAKTQSGSTFKDLWEHLRHGTATVACFPPQPREGDCFLLCFDESLAGQVIELAVTAEAQGTGVRPDRPPLVWEASSGDHWAEITVPTQPSLRDTTGALNKSGRIVLALPARHDLQEIDGVRGYWLRARLVQPTAERPGYTEAPQVSAIVPASLGVTVLAEHAEIVEDEEVGVGTNRPGLTLGVQRRPVMPRDESARRTSLVGTYTTSAVGDDRDDVPATTQTVTWTRQWHEVSDFAASGPDDLHYTLDSFSGEISFGPRIRYPEPPRTELRARRPANSPPVYFRQHGAIPREDERLVMTSYRTGGGAAGQVGANTISGMRQPIASVSGVTNLAASFGGVDAESVDNAKQRAPLTLRAGGRAVTPSDFERLTLQADRRVARADCVPATKPGDPTTILVVKEQAVDARDIDFDAFALDTDLCDNVERYLDERRVLGTSLLVTTPYLVSVSVAALVKPLANRNALVVQRDTEQRLYEFVNPLTGGPDGNGWPYGVDLTASLIADLLMQVDGVARVGEVLFFGFDPDASTDGGTRGERVGEGSEIFRCPPQSLFVSESHRVVVK